MRTSLVVNHIIIESISIEVYREKLTVQGEDLLALVNRIFLVIDISGYLFKIGYSTRGSKRGRERKSVENNKKFSSRGLDDDALSKERK